MAEKKKQAPCSKWMHHKWLPTRAELAAEAVANVEVGESFNGKQKCAFCGDERDILITINEELVEE